MTYSPSKLSVGLIFRSSKIWRWQSELVQALINASLVNIEEIVIQSDQPLELPSKVARLHALDAMVFRSSMTAFELVDLEAPETSNVYHGLDQPPTSQVDFWVNFSENSIGDEFIGRSESVLLETQFSEQASPVSLESIKAGYSEFSRGDKQCYFSVVAHSPDGTSLIIAESRPSLENGPLSRSMNQYWKLLQTAWLRTFTKLQTNALETLALGELNDQLEPESSKTNFMEDRAYRNLANIFIDKFKQKFVHKEQWVLLMKFLDREEGVKQLPLSFADYVEISPPSDCFWADPFVVSDNNRHYVFFEELPFETELGHLSCMEVFSDGSHTDPKVILKKPYHLSYPNVFAFESNYYMVPESGDTGFISLYKSTNFPYQWQHEYNLLEGLHAYDSTLFEYQGVWWLFACVAAEKGMSGNEELHIFYADSPLSRSWDAHMKNPMISDASRARPAGKLFNHQGELYRPSQDCAGSYGAGLNINKVVELTKQSYEEELVQCSRPTWDPKLTALHTLNFNQYVSVADAMRVENRFLSK